MQFLPADVAGEVKAYLVGKPVGVRVWNSTWFEHGADVIRDDAAFAGLPIDVQTPTGLEVLDFRSLRGTLGTMLDEAGLSLKVRQTILRHSDPRLALNRYTKATTPPPGAR